MQVYKKAMPSHDPIYASSNYVKVIYRTFWASVSYLLN